jgi:hypothetical protein
LTKLKRVKIELKNLFERLEKEKEDRRGKKNRKTDKEDSERILWLKRREKEIEVRRGERKRKRKTVEEDREIKKTIYGEIEKKEIEEDTEKERKD